MPFPLGGIAVQIKIGPRSPLADQPSTFDCDHCFTERVRLVVTTAMHAFARVLGDVLRSTLAGFAEADVDDVGIAGEVVPSVRKP